MAQRVQRFDIVSPKNQPFPNTVTDRVDFAPGIVTAITIEIPAGHAGKTGIAIFYGNAQLIPFDGTAYMKGNHKTTRYDFDDPHPGGIGWFVDHFNSDHYAHTFHIAVELDELASALLRLPPVLLLRQSGETFSGSGIGDVTPTPTPAPVGGNTGPVRVE